MKTNTNQQIQLFKPSYRIDECLNQIKECLEKGWTGLGFKTVQLEDEWKKYTGLNNAHFLNSATAGLNLAFEILKEKLNWQDDDEVITTPLTFVSTNHAILHNNLKPVFADVDEYLCIDPESVKQKITSKTKAICFVGMGGNTGQYEEIEKIAKENDLALVLDAAHMAGTRLSGITPGKNADCVIYSFQAVKNMPTADSGMICFKENKYDEIARKKTWLGISKDTYTRTSSKGAYKWMYDVEHVGHKCHGNSIMAAIGLVQLKYLDADNSYRRQLCAWYDEFLKKEKNIKRVPVALNCESSRHLYQIIIDNRDELLLALNECGIYPGVHYRDNTEYKMYEYARETCPVAQDISNKILSLPLHLQMTRSDVQYISEMVIKYST